MMPFRIEEIPFILYFDKYGNSDFLEYNYHQESKSTLLRFVRKSIGENMRKPGPKGLRQLIKSPQTDKTSVIYVSKSYKPTAFSYLGYKFGDMLDVVTTNFGEHKVVHAETQVPYDYVFKLQKGLKFEDKDYFGLEFDKKVAREEEAHMNVFTLAKFLLIPEIKRNSFSDFCKEYTVSEKAESNKYSVCVLALRQPGKQEQFDEMMEAFREEQNRLLPTFAEKIQTMETEVFDMFRTIQFGYIDVASNKAFG